MLFGRIEDHTKLPYANDELTAAKPWKPFREAERNRQNLSPSLGKSKVRALKLQPFLIEFSASDLIL